MSGWYASVRFHTAYTDFTTKQKKCGCFLVRLRHNLPILFIYFCFFASFFAFCTFFFASSLV